MNKEIIEIAINTAEIKLDQFLKWANIVSSGGEAKQLIASGIVTVNQVVETRRGRKLKDGDIVGLQNERFYKVISLA